MSRISELNDNQVAAETRVFAYGFDAAGFHTQRESISLTGVGRIEFLDFHDSTSLEAADGVIIPQGIFEEINSQPSRFVGPRTTVSVAKPLLLERERQLFNLLRAGKWVCFLVGEIVDEVSQGIHSEPIHDTDLCKRILNAFAVGRRRKYQLYTGTRRQVKAREKEFESYVRAYGTPTTVFEFPHLHPIERHVIVEFGQQAASYAKTLNVLIVRTIDLLLLMRQLEKDTRRGGKLTRLLLSGGGWLKTDIEKPRK